MLLELQAVALEEMFSAVAEVRVVYWFQKR